MLQREQFSILSCTESKSLFRSWPVACCSKSLLTRDDQLDRTVQIPRSNGSKTAVRPCPSLAAEARA